MHRYPVVPALSLLLALLPVIACKRSGDPGSNAAASAALSASASAPSPGASASAALLEAARKELEKPLELLRSADSASVRRVAYELLCMQLEKKKGILPDQELDTRRSRRADELLKELEGLRQSTAEILDRPVYQGAYRLGGAVRQCYKDGVVLESQGKLYFIKDAVCPDEPLLHGWVDDTGDTVTLDLGRNGREAKVVEISDKEKAQDDRKEFNQQMAAYSKALAANPDLPKERERRKAKERSIEEQLDAVLLAFVKTPSLASSGQPPRTP